MFRMETKLEVRKILFGITGLSCKIGFAYLGLFSAYKYNPDIFWCMIGILIFHNFITFLCMDIIRE